LKSTYNPLIDKAPTEYGGYKINTDFRVVLRFFRLVEDEDLSEDDKVKTALLMFFWDGKEAVNVSKAQMLLDYIVKYYIPCGQEFEDDGSEKTFDIDVDSGRIYSAFRQAYGIDLHKESLHWWDFTELMNDLPNDTKLAEVVGYRSMDVPDAKSDKKYRAFVLRMKAMYALKKEGVNEQIGDIFDMLWKG